MDDAALMGGFKGFGDLAGEGLDFREGDRTSFHAVADGLARDQFHGEGSAAVGFDESVDDGDVGMVQRGEDFRFAIEASEAVGVVGEGPGENFDGGVAVELGVAGAVDFAHAARAQGREDSVVAELVAWGERHGWIENILHEAHRLKLMPHWIC